MTMEEMTMDSGSTADLHDQFQQLTGALDIIVLLREEMEQWLEEAQDDSKQETLENVVGHLQAMEEEYKNRSADLQEKLASV
jgi:chaperonin cofactor prefoldin